MSRHLFFTMHQGELTVVLIGWNTTYEGFYMQVNKPDSTQTKLLYSHLTDKDSYPKSLTPYLEVLNHYQIHLPLPMVQEVSDDGVHNIGTKDVTHYMHEGQYQRETGINEALLSLSHL